MANYNLQPVVDLLDESITKLKALQTKESSIVQVIESINNGPTDWIISLTDNNPEAKDSFIVSGEDEAFRIKEMLEIWKKN